MGPKEMDRIFRKQKTAAAASDVLTALFILLYLAAVYSRLHMMNSGWEILLFLLILPAVRLQSRHFFRCFLLYCWNISWEEKYREKLSLGGVAPNIETVDFPGINHHAAGGGD